MHTSSHDGPAIQKSTKYGFKLRQTRAKIYVQKVQFKMAFESCGTKTTIQLCFTWFFRNSV